MCIFKRLGQKHRSLIKKKDFMKGGGIVWGRQPPADCRLLFSLPYSFGAAHTEPSTVSWLHMSLEAGRPDCHHFSHGSPLSASLVPLLY